LGGAMKTSLQQNCKSADIPQTSVALNVGAWMLALGAFIFAVVLSYREIHYNIPNDLRSPAILLIEAFLAAITASGFALHEGSLKCWTDVHLCLRFGLWAAAIFRLLPPVMNEDVLYLKNCGTFDLPYVVLGACVHGGLTVLFTSPYAIRVLDRPSWASDESILEMCGAVILIFFVVACIVRLLSENW
jgi:hypothetical protein